MANIVVKSAALGTRSLALFIIIILLLFTTPSSAKFGRGGFRLFRGESRSYGTGSHSYRTGSHSYGTGSHSYGTRYRSSGSGTHSGSGSHSYPSSNGYSGTGKSGAHTYPASTGISGNNINNHITNQNTPHHNSPSYGSKTEVHHHHHYSPPQQVTFGAVSYPVYHAQPPVYVYQYRDSGSRYDHLLTGLALYNLGRMSASDHHHYTDRRYVGTPGEVCKLGIRKNNGDYEETRVNCEVISSFIWDSDLHATQTQRNAPKSSVSTTVVNVTQTQIGDLHSNNSVTKITVTNTTVVDALEAKGKSIEVAPDMMCYMIRITHTSNMKKEIKCGVLEAYARSSWRNAGVKLSSNLPLLLLVIYKVLLNV